jgi:hypothetical protein
MCFFTTFYHFETLFTTSVEKLGVMNIVSFIIILYTKKCDMVCVSLLAILTEEMMVFKNDQKRVIF